MQGRASRVTPRRSHTTLHPSCPPTFRVPGKGKSGAAGLLLSHAAVMTFSDITVGKTGSAAKTPS